MGHELDRKVWAPDGVEWHAQIGLVTPDDDPIPGSRIQTHASHLTPSRRQTEVDPGETYTRVRNHVPSNAEAVFIGGNGYRTIGVIAALEEDLGRPVLTGNQVAFWYALRLAVSEPRLRVTVRSLRQSCPAG
jgi:hypothetical protein